MRLVAFRDFKFRERVDCYGNIEYQFKASHIVFSKPIQMTNNFEFLIKKGLLPIFDKNLNNLISRTDLTFFYKLVKPKEHLAKSLSEDKLKSPSGSNYGKGVTT